MAKVDDGHLGHGQVYERTPPSHTTVHMGRVQGSSADGVAARQQPDVVVHIETRTRPFLFADAEFDAVPYAGTPGQVANWAGTRALLLLHEDVVPVCSPSLLQAHKLKGKAVAPAAIARLPLLRAASRGDFVLGRGLLR